MGFGFIGWGEMKEYLFNLFCVLVVYGYIVGCYLVGIALFALIVILPIVVVTKFIMGVV